MLRQLLILDDYIRSIYIKTGGLIRIGITAERRLLCNLIAASIIYLHELAAEGDIAKHEYFK